MRPLSWADRHPVLSLVAACAVIYTGLRVWSLVHDGDVLLANESGKDRMELYGQITSSSVALLGVSITVLAILIAFPDRPRAEQLRKRNSWRLLQATLLSTALFCFLTLVAGHVASAVDGAAEGKEWLEQVVVAPAATGVLALIVGGGTFALLLKATRAPADPSEGRGAGCA